MVQTSFKSLELRLLADDKLNSFLKAKEELETFFNEKGIKDELRKQEIERLKPVSAIYWGLMTAGYLGYSFITMDWQRSWIIWPVAGVLYGVVYAVASSVQKKR